MRTIRYAGRNHIVTFQTQSVERLADVGMEQVKETVCYILGDGLCTLGSGAAQCSPLDTFDPLTAYRMAFGRAVTNTFPHDADAREVLWDGFHEAVRNEKKAKALSAVPPYLPSPEVMPQAKQREILEAQNKRFQKIIRDCPMVDCDACANLANVLHTVQFQLTQLSSVGA